MFSAENQVLNRLAEFELTRGRLMKIWTDDATKNNEGISECFEE